MAFCRSFAFFFLHKISQPSWFFKHDTFTSLILLMGHTIKMNASTNGADFDTPAQPQRTTRTWQISFLERVCKMSSESCCKTQPPLSPKWCLPSTNAQFSGANPNSSWGGAGGGETQECPANSCCVTLSIAVQARLPNWGLFWKVSPAATQKTLLCCTLQHHFPPLHGSSSRAANAVCWCNNICSGVRTAQQSGPCASTHFRANGTAESAATRAGMLTLFALLALK